jgi:hypothetical protein
MLSKGASEWSAAQWEEEEQAPTADDLSSPSLLPSFDVSTLPMWVAVEGKTRQCIECPGASRSSRDRLRRPRLCHGLIGGKVSEDETRISVQQYLSKLMSLRSQSAVLSSCNGLWYQRDEFRLTAVLKT